MAELTEEMTRELIEEYIALYERTYGEGMMGRRICYALRAMLDDMDVLRAALAESLAAFACITRTIASVDPHISALTETKYDGFGVRGKQALARTARWAEGK